MEASGARAARPQAESGGNRTFRRAGERGMMDCAWSSSSATSSVACSQPRRPARSGRSHGCSVRCNQLCSVTSPLARRGMPKTLPRRCGSRSPAPSPPSRVMSNGSAPSSSPLRTGACSTAGATGHGGASTRLRRLPRYCAGDDPAGEVAARLDGDRLARRVAEILPKAHAEIVLLRVVAGLSAEEVGQIVGKRPENVRVIQHRALRQLAEEFRDAP